MPWRSLIAFGVTLALCPLVLWALRRARVFDVPTDRSSHSQPVPRGGGLAPAFGVILAMGVSSVVRGYGRWSLVAVAGVFALVGLADDLVGIPPIPRLVLQAVAAALALPVLLVELNGPAAWQLLFAVGVYVWLVAYVNAFNFMDGIDGISAAQVLVAGTAWWLVGRSQEVAFFAAGGTIVGAAALAFLPWNFPRARMFLGDVGSYFFGGALAALTVFGLRGGLPPEAVLAPLAVYLTDTAVTLIRRVRQGETWYRAHRDHTYQRLVRLGWSHARVTVYVAGVMVACSALGAVSLAGSLALRVVADFGIGVVLVAYLLTPTLAARLSRRDAMAMPEAGLDRHATTPS
jgi:UDP-N-acetylmuramyl pentapeptide phosphotransferase/UDP-N-acetylglucosamine-1-phosphate transferase